MLNSKGRLTAHSELDAGTNAQTKRPGNLISDARWNAQKSLLDAANIVSDQALRARNHAVSTAKIIISAEERLRMRIRSILRFTLATVFFAISGLISLGANATTAFAKKASSGKRHHGLRMKAHRATLRYHHSAMNGMASWYGHQFNHRRTASGVRFDTHAMMAAHRTLPFGTKVLVTNLENHKTCVVEITDRGPYARGRIIDLSYAAAEQLGMTEQGVAPVQLSVLGAGPSVSDDLASQPDLLNGSNAPVTDVVQTLVVDEPTP